jgi:FAD synthase
LVEALDVVAKDVEIKKNYGLEAMVFSFNPNLSQPYLRLALGFWLTKITEPTQLVAQCNVNAFFINLWH